MDEEKRVLMWLILRLMAACATAEDYLNETGRDEYAKEVRSMLAEALREAERILPKSSDVADKIIKCHKLVS